MRRSKRKSSNWPEKAGPAEKQRTAVIPGDVFRHGQGEAVHHADLHQKVLNVPAPMADNLLVQVSLEVLAHGFFQGFSIRRALLNPAEKESQSHDISLVEVQKLLNPRGLQPQTQGGAPLCQLPVGHPQVILRDNGEL